MEKWSCCWCKKHPEAITGQTNKVERYFKDGAKEQGETSTESVNKILNTNTVKLEPPIEIIILTVL